MVQLNYMNILILNWRSPYDYRSGGAEKITLKYVNYWADKGHKIFWLSSTPIIKDLYQMVELNDAVKLINIGITFPNGLVQVVYFPILLLKMIFHSMKVIKNNDIDVVIDEIHGLPFFTPFYSKKRNILLVCEVAGSIWDKMYPTPINLIGKWLEKLVYQIYVKTEVWAISSTTKEDINVLNPNIKVKILPLGIDTKLDSIQEFRNEEKFEFPSAVFLARIVKMKGIEIALDAVEIISKTFPNFKLYVIGHGEEDYILKLKNLVIEKDIEKNVEFLGFITENEKFNYLSKVHFLFHPSYKEGFGLTVLEAALVGTPSIVKKGSNLDTLIIEGKTGFSVDTVNGFANIFIQFYNDKIAFDLLSKQSLHYIKQYDWDIVLKKSIEITNI